MASSWGLSWGSSWGTSWGQSVVPPTPVEIHQPGGGYRRPIIYLDDEGRPVKLHEHKRHREPEVVEHLPNLPLDVLMALLFPQDEDQGQALAAMLAQAEGRLGMAEMERVHARFQSEQEEDDAAIILLLSS